VRLRLALALLAAAGLAPAPGARASEGQAVAAPELAPDLAPGAHTRRESWYSYWGLGVMHPVYERPVQATLDQLQAGGASRFSYSYDLLGFYWPLSVRHNDLAGFVLDGQTDSYSSSGDTFAINQYLFALSFMRFYGPEIGEGVFLRGDVGAARWFLTETSADSLSSDWGFGGLGGVGYGLAVSKGVRLLVQLDLGYRYVQSRSYESGALTLGALF
jgi:hypothetical protein